MRFCAAVLGRPGGDRLSRVLRRSTMGAEGFDGRVRNGIGFGPLAWATRPAKHSAGEAGDGTRAIGEQGSMLVGWATALLPYCLIPLFPCCTGLSCRAAFAPTGID